MKLKSLHLYNFLSHQDTMLELAGTSVIRGENGAGKSTIEQALEMLYTGRSDSTDDKGTGARDLIRRGCDKSAITAEIEDAGRLIKYRCSITEKSGRTIAIKDPADESWTGSDWLAMLAMKREVLDCLCNGRYFVGMEDKRQKALLAAIILPTTAVWEPWVEGAVNQCSLRVDWSQKAFDVIASAYDLAYNERKLINRLIKEWREPEAVPAQAQDIPAIKARLAERQTQRTQAAIAREKTLEAHLRAGRERTNRQEKLLSLQGKLTKELALKSQVGKDILSKGKLKEMQDTAKISDKAKKLDAEIAQLNADLTAAKQANSALAALGEADQCPTCHQAMTPDAFVAIAKPIQDRYNELGQKYQAALDTRRAMGDYEAAQRAIEAHAQAEKQAALVARHVQEIEEEIGRLKAEAENQPENEAPDTSEADAAIADLDRRLQVGNDALTQALQADSKRQHYGAQIEAKGKLDAKQALLEKLCDYFGPKGVQAKLLDEHVGAFQGSMNSVLAAWGFQAHLQFEPYMFGVSFTGNNEQVYPLKTISKSQKFRFSIAFQVALAKVSGFNFVIVDEADMLLDGNRKLLYQSLIAAKLDQVVVMQSDSRREIPKIADAVFYMLTLSPNGGVPTSVVERL